VHAVGLIDSRNALRIIKERGLNEGRDLVASSRQEHDGVMLFAQAMFAFIGFFWATRPPTVPTFGDYLVQSLFIVVSLSLLVLGFRLRHKSQRLLGITLAARFAPSQSGTMPAVSATGEINPTKGV
jgi:hypothetical protein